MCQERQSVESSDGYKSDLIAVQGPIIQQEVRRVALPYSNQERAGDGRISPKVIRHSRVFSKALPLWSTAIETVFCQPSIGILVTTTLTELSKTKAVAGTEVI